MKDEIITGYTPVLVKIEPAKDEVIILNFNINSTQEGSFTCDSVSLKRSELLRIVDALAKEGLILRITTSEFVEALESLYLDNSTILLLVKELLLAQINLYDVSEAVNSFYLGDKRMWLDKATRVGLMNSVTIEKNAGKDMYTLWFDNQYFELPVDKAIQMLQIVELYAVECYNVTAQHLAEVRSFTSLPEATSFDFTAGYPEFVVLQ